MAVKKPNTKKYDEAYRSFSSSIETFIIKLVNKLNRLTLKVEKFSSSSLTLKDNTLYVYNGSGLSSLTLKYPSGNFISTILFSTSPTATSIKVDFPSGTSFIGSAPYEFFPGENWELNIHNGTVVGGQIYKNT